MLTVHMDGSVRWMEKRITRNSGTFFDNGDCLQFRNVSCGISHGLPSRRARRCINCKIKKINIRITDKKD